MSDEMQAKRGEAAWKEQREAISQRNAAAQKRAQAERKSRESGVEMRIREQARHERVQVAALNARLDKRRRAR